MPQPPTNNHAHTIFRNDCPDCKHIQDDAYKLLARSGFKDLEIHEDRDGFLTGELNDRRLGSNEHRAVSTMVSLDAAEARADGEADPVGDNAALSENLDTFGQPTTVWETPVAHRWRFYSAEVQALPPRYPRRAFLEAWAEKGGDVVNAAKACGLTRWVGREAVRKFKDRLRREGKLG